jgi:hypothetical protein
MKKDFDVSEERSKKYGNSASISKHDPASR